MYYHYVLNGIYEFLSDKATAFFENFNPSMSPSYETDWKTHFGQEHVAKLTPETLRTFLKQHERAMVMFYAPWCHHCKKLTPEFSRAAANLAGESGSAKLGCVDCTRYPAVYRDHSINGYPTLNYYHNGNYVGEYNRGRRAADLVQFMLRGPKTRSDM